ncbi:ABC transporter ATP-binding protein/permease [Acidipropionibacterium thoenii]|uniref:glutathione/L-cysteine transport system ATP-binding/permease protein CydD n=1 Tax=Acidipropionibacterium thoenii TaxID=1751 RepID=UPI00068604C0|nr:ABC transporter ATP-binding protein/permease [Acidipropionibacterium thoenii]
MALCVTGVVTAVLVLCQAWLLARAISSVFATHRTDGLGRWCLLLGTVFAGRAVTSWATEWLSHRAAAQVKSQLRGDLVSARLSHPTDATVTSSTLITLITTGLDALDGFYAKYLPQLVLACIVPVVLAVAIGLQDLTSVIIIAVTIPLIPVFMALIGWRTEAAMARRFRVQTRLANHFADLMTGLVTLQVFGRARAQLEGLRRTEGANRSETMRTLRVSFLSSFALELLATLSVALVAVTIGFRVAGGGMDLRTALFILILAPEVYLPVREVGARYHDSADGMAAAEAAFAVIERGRTPVGGPAGSSSAARPTEVPSPREAPVLLEGLTYRYPDARRSPGGTPASGGAPAAGRTPAAGGASSPDRVVSPHTPPALSGLSLRVDPGETVALAGHSGSGKTTALDCLLGFLTPESGRIQVGGVDLTAAPPASWAAWRRRLAYVPQNPGMMRGSVADNLLLGYPAATDAQLRDALDRCGGTRLALDKEVDDDAEGLSAGERRRVALARALLRVEQDGAGMLILDEPTAGLDDATESTVLATVRALGASVLVVSHRPQVLQDADRVITLESAQVAS